MKHIFFMHCITNRIILNTLLLSVFLSISSNVYASYPSDTQPITANNVSNKPLVIGIFPRRNKSVSRKIYTPLAKYLSEKSHRKVILKTPRTFNLFWDNVQNEKYDLVHYNQYHYIISNKKYNYHVILRNKEFGSDTVTGAILVRADSNIDKVEDLKGKKITFGGGPKAMQSYIYARYLLEKNNLHVGDYIEEYTLNPPNALFSIYYKKNDAAGVGDKTIKINMVKSQIDTSKLKTLIQGKQLPHLPWAIHTSLNVKTQEIIKNLLASLHKSTEGKAILKAAKLDQFVITEDSDYDEHRKIIKAVLNEDY